MKKSAHVFAVVTIVGLAATAVSAQDLDILIRHGEVVDGSGSPPVKIDVGISGDRITFIGDGSGKRAKRTIEADGLIVAPGFIDPHTHTLEDLSNPKRSR